jgi:predicted phage tail protein
MKTVKLYGELAEKFGDSWELDVKSPAEALRAIEANQPGLVKHIHDSDAEGVGYRIVAGDRDLTAEQAHNSTGAELIHIVPVIGGAKKAGVGQIILGAIIVIIGVIMTFIPGLQALAPYVISMGVSMMIGGVAMMLAGVAKADTTPAAQAEKLSYNFNGPSNRMQQGMPVPVGYGRMIIGAMPISAGLSVDNLI